MRILKPETYWEKEERRNETPEQKKDRLFRRLGSLSFVVVMVGMGVLAIMEKTPQQKTIRSSQERSTAPTEKILSDSTDNKSPSTIPFPKE